MRVLMFGWEFPPQNSGGLGTACYGLTKGLSEHEVNVTFVMPHMGPHDHDFLRVISAADIAHVNIKTVDSTLTPYLTTKGYAKRILKYGQSQKNNLYGKDLHAEVHRFSEQAAIIAENEEFDVIHAHDWITFPAGIKAKKRSKKPLVVHVHATEFDRTGGNVNQYVYNIEREGMHEADAIIAVSNYTKNKIVEHYGISPEKVKVVHNAVIWENAPGRIPRKDKVVLFLGRITLQKGPDYFLYAAHRVLQHDPDTTFVIAGSGDMQPFIIEKAAELGIADKVLFSGFLSGSDVDRAYQMADLYVMPSVSEPFGITPLEAMRNGTPVLISKQSGVSEVITHCLKCDFWDIDQMANMMLSVLRYPALSGSLTDNGSVEVKGFNWKDSAKKCIDVYHALGVHHG
ncbi:MAG: glycosyltransferase family 4 protein [Nanoarchaeota archaeon]